MQRAIRARTTPSASLLSDYRKWIDIRLRWNSSSSWFVPSYARDIKTGSLGRSVGYLPLRKESDDRLRSFSR